MKKLGLSGLTCALPVLMHFLAVNFKGCSDVIKYIWRCLMRRIKRGLLCLAVIFLSIACTEQAYSAVLLSQQSFSSAIKDKHQIVRTSTDRLYCFVLNYTTLDGYSLAPYTSLDGATWQKSKFLPSAARLRNLVLPSTVRT